MGHKNKLAKKQVHRRRPTWLDYCSKEEREECNEIDRTRKELSRRKRLIAQRAYQRMLRRHA